MEGFVKARVAAGARTLEGRYYHAPEIFEQERERIFARDWICVGRLEQLEHAGDFFLAGVAGESLIIARGKDDRVRAFYNVCRHRGTRMCTESTGRFNGSMQCPYHAWTYALDGTLIAARTMSDLSGFDRADYPLHEAALATFEGFIFVNLAREPQPFEATFAPLTGRFSRWHIEELRTARTIEYDIACNWKLVFQNYSECYHCPLLHPQLEEISSSESGRNDLTEGPFLGGYSQLRHGAATLTPSGATARAPLGELGGDDRSRVYYYSIFPSLLLSLHPDYVMAHVIEPIAPNRTTVRCAWLFDPVEMNRPDFDPRDAVGFWDLTNRQDWRINERTQLGTASRAYTPGPYADGEGLLERFDRHYLETLRG